jgi:hypothetical protein
MSLCLYGEALIRQAMDSIWPACSGSWPRERRRGSGRAPQSLLTAVRWPVWKNGGRPPGGNGARQLAETRQKNRERRALPWRTLDGNVTAHQPAEVPADREAKARAAIPTRGRGISLGEGLEELAHLLGRHADA